MNGQNIIHTSEYYICACLMIDAYYWNWRLMQCTAALKLTMAQKFKRWIRRQRRRRLTNIQITSKKKKETKNMQTARRDFHLLVRPVHKVYRLLLSFRFVTASKGFESGYTFICYCYRRPPLLFDRSLFAISFDCRHYYNHLPKFIRIVCKLDTSHDVQFPLDLSNAFKSLCIRCW